MSKFEEVITSEEDLHLYIKGFSAWSLNTKVKTLYCLVELLCYQRNYDFNIYKRYFTDHKIKFDTRKITMYLLKTTSPEKIVVREMFGIISKKTIFVPDIDVPIFTIKQDSINTVGTDGWRYYIFATDDQIDYKEILKQKVLEKLQKEYKKIEENIKLVQAL